MGTHYDGCWMNHKECFDSKFLYWDSPSGLGRIYCGDCRDIMSMLSLDLEIDNISTCITSPPYWQARKYVSDDELGQESNYVDYINHLCEIFDIANPLFRTDASLFVNLGDKYFSHSVGTGGKTKKQLTNSGSFFSQSRKLVPNMVDGNLMSIPHRFAIKMVDDYDWTHKHTLIWHKPNAFPTSNKKKFTLDYEYLFHFVLDPKKYYFKQQFEPFVENTDVLYRKKLRKNKQYNVKEPYENNTPYKHNDSRITSQESPNRMWEDNESLERQLEQGRIKRSVWSINTKPYKGSHSATFPEKLIIIPILATCPEDGIVLDMFFGAGTTGLVCEKLNRRWIGIELSEEYCQLAKERITNVK
jgi:DNA modification methylase